MACSSHFAALLNLLLLLDERLFQRHDYKVLPDPNLTGKEESHTHCRTRHDTTTTTTTAIATARLFQSRCVLCLELDDVSLFLFFSLSIPAIIIKKGEPSQSRFLPFSFCVYT